MSEPDPLIHRAAEAVADRVPIDWARASERIVSPPQQELLDNLRDIGDFATTRDGARIPAIGAGAQRSTFVALIAFVATVQITVGLAGFAIGRADNQATPAIWQLLVLIVFAASGLWLVVGGRQDGRAALLGAFYLVLATSFSQRFIGWIAGTPRAFWACLYLDALLPYLMWRFVHVFPSVERFSRDDRRASGIAGLALTVGVGLIALNLALPFADGPTAERLAPLTRWQGSSSLYWAIISVLLLAALVTAPFRARSAATAERRRVAWFLLGIAVGFAPIFLDLVFEVVVPSMAARITPALAVGFSYPFLALVPVITAYAVTVDRLVDVSFVVRRALQYALARVAIVILTIIPLALLALLGARYRQLTVGELISMPVGRALIGVALVGVILLSTRDRLLAGIDRLFRKKTPSLDRAVAALTSNIRDAIDVRELSHRIEPIFDEMLGTSRSVVLALNQGATAFEPLERGWAVLPIESGIVALLGDEEEPIELGRDERNGLFNLLPAAEQTWLEDNRCAAVSPLRGRTGELLGILALGPKDGGLPFEQADRVVLRGMSGPIALVLDQILQARRSQAAEDLEAASECVTCGAVLPGDADACACGGRLRTAAVPARVAGKFVVERRLGAGAMGTAYLARDVALQRPVVIKALPRRVAGATHQLAGEARAMARVSDSRLAMIFGVETWRGAPLLVMEYLPGGTLADRIRRSPLPPSEALSIGITLGRGLQVLHDNGLLHRDIKPSNVAFSADGGPKLLDFGLATLTADSDSPGELAGTPLYLAPELVAGGSPGPASDLWSLSLVLYESIARTHPFASDSVTNTLRLVAAARVPDLRSVDDSVPPAVCEIFNTLLAQDVSKRPATAVEMIDRLGTALAQIA